MGQKLIAINFGKSSSPVFWNQKYNPVFKIEVSRDREIWIDISNLKYCPRLLDIQPSTPILPGDLVTEQLTNSKLRKIIQKGQSLTFFVDDNVDYWRISYKDDFLTLGEWEEIAGTSSWKIIITQLGATFRYRVAGDTDNDDLPESNGRAVINAIYGNTVKWNQQVKNGNFANDSTDEWNIGSNVRVSFTTEHRLKLEKGSITSFGGVFRKAIKGSSQDTGENPVIKLIEGHKYYGSVDCFDINIRPSSQNASFGFMRTNGTQQIYGTPLSIGHIAFIRMFESMVNNFSIESFGIRVGYGSAAEDSYVVVDNIQCIDLTDIFGTDAEIAAALGIQEADITTDTGVAAFEAWLALNVGEQDYYPHDEGSLISFKGTGVKTYIDGWNQLSSINQTWSAQRGTITKDEDTITLTALGTGVSYITHNVSNLTVDKIVYYSAFFKPSIDTKIQLALRTTETIYIAEKNVLANSTTRLKSINKAPANIQQVRYFISDTTPQSGDTLQLWNDQIIDLTTLFGTDAQIAAALGIEEADITTSTGVAAFEEWLQVHIGRQDYYEYTQPSKFPIDEKPFDVTKVYGKLNGQGEYKQVFTNKDSGDQSISYYGMNFVDNSYYTKEDKIYIDPDTGKLTAIQATKKADLGNAKWELYTGQSHTFRTSTYGTSGTDKNPVNIVGYNTQVTNVLTDSSGDLLANFSSGGTRGLRIVNQSLSSSDIVDGKIAALKGVEMVYGLIPPNIYTELIYRDNGTDTPLEEVFPIKYKVDKYSTEELLVPASVAGEPTSTALVADIDYQKLSL